MLKDLKSTTKHSIFYATGNIAIKIIGIILLPIYTDQQYLSQADFGALAILEATSQILVGILSFALVGGLQRWYWDMTYKNHQKSIFYTTLIFLLLINIPILSLLYVFSNTLSLLIFNSTDYIILLQLTLVTVGFRIFNNQILNVVKLQSRSLFFSFVQVLKLVVTLVITIILVVSYHKGLEGIWTAALIGEVFTLLLLCPFTIKNITYSFEYKVLKDILKYSYPLMLSTLAIVILTTTDKYMINSKSGLILTGIYSLGYRLANTLNIVVTASLNSALAPIRMKKMNEQNNKRFYAKLLTYSSFVFVAAALALSLFILEILKLIAKSPEYWIASGIVPILSLAFLITLMRHNVNIGLLIMKKTKIVAKYIFITALINVFLNWLLIPIFDIYGASVATILAQLILFSFLFRAAQHEYYIPYEINKIILMVIVAAIIIILGMQLSELKVVLRIVGKVVLLLSFPIILYVFRFFEPIEIETIKKIVQKGSKLSIKENIKHFLQNS